MAVLYGWLLFRTTRGFEIRIAGASPDAARYAGMSPRNLIIWTMTVSGMLGGMAGATDLLGATHSMTTTYGTTVGFDAIAVALLGRTSPIGIVLAALLFGAMRTGASAMQIQAGVPAELVGVLQATILFFLVVEPGHQADLPAQGREDRPRGLDADLHGDLRRGGDDPLMDQFLYGIPIIGLVFEFIGYLDRHPPRSSRRSS